jgi:V8-like Glu-specific endopeptidase
MSLAASADFMFPAEQFGEARLVPTQSTGRQLESLGNIAARWETISSFRDDDPIQAFARPTGRLDILVEADGKQGAASCTAAIIDHDKIITNYHCVPGRDGVAVSAEIRMGYLYPDGEGSKVYRVDIDPLESDRGLDYSILRVEGDPSAEYGTVALAHRQALEIEHLFLVHYPEGQPERLTRAFCNAVSGNPVQGQELRHRCDTLPGSSGSLIFSQSDNALVGLHHSGGLAYQDINSYNSATDSSALFQSSSILQSLCCSADTASVAAIEPPPAALRRGWMFLGRYQGQGRWRDPRADALVGYAPGDFVGLKLTLNIGVNLRDGPFRVTASENKSCDIEETNIIGGLSEGASAEVLRLVRLTPCSSYVWAEVEF